MVRWVRVWQHLQVKPISSFGISEASLEFANASLIDSTSEDGGLDSNLVDSFVEYSLPVIIRVLVSGKSALVLRNL